MYRDIQFKINILFIMNFLGFTIDKLELCYTAPIDALRHLEHESIIDYANLCFQKKVHNNSRIQFDVIVNDPNDEATMKQVGTLRVSLSDFYNDSDTIYFWFAFDNKFLYTFDLQSRVLDYLD